MTGKPYKTAEEIALDNIKRGGGTFTVNFCKDQVQPGLLRTLNKMVDGGRLMKTTSADQLTHTFALPQAKEA